MRSLQPTRRTVLRHALGIGTIAAAGGWAVRASAADAWPERPLRIIVPAGPGSVPDVRARWLAERLTPLLGQPVLIDNRPGAGGNVAMAAVARSPADGYTLVLTHQGLMALNPFLYERPGYDALRDFVCITRVGVGPLLLLVSPASPSTTLPEFVQAARATPQGTSFGSLGIGTPPHLAAELFMRAAGFQATHLPYTSPTQPIADLIAGRLQWLMEGTPVALPLVQAGRLRALAVSGAKRLPALPDVPTLAEAGWPEVVYVGWTGLAAPAETPPAVIDRLWRESAKVLLSDEAVAWFGSVGNEPGGESPEATARIVRADHERWGAVIKAIGIRAQ